MRFTDFFKEKYASKVASVVKITFRDEYPALNIIGLFSNNMGSLSGVDLDSDVFSGYEIRHKNFDCNSLLIDFKNEAEYHKLNNEFTKIVVRDISKTITVAVIDCKNDKTQSIVFFGVIF